MKIKLFALSLVLLAGTALADVDCTKNPDHPLCQSSSSTDSASTTIDIKDEAPTVDPEPTLIDEPSTEEIAPSVDTSSDLELDDSSSSEGNTESDSF